MASREPQQKDRAAQREPSPPLAEWLVAACGLLLLVASLGFLTLEALGEPGQTPVPAVETLGIEPQQGRFLVQVRVHNRGDAPAERVRIVGQLRQQGTVVEEREAEVDLLPGRASREAGLYFSRDPRGADLQLHAGSYLRP